jgi:hypothetical protein
MRSNRGNFFPSLVGDLSVYTDPFARGLHYLYGVQTLALDAEMVNMIENLSDRTAIYTWIGNHVASVNTTLNACLNICQECFHPWQQCHVQIFAVPLAESFGIAGLCNVFTSPPTILIDVGRVAAQDWLGLVAHEYAHVQVGSPGHHQDFMATLMHLCLGLGLEPPPPAPGVAASLRHWPPYISTLDPLAFWKGQKYDKRM